jgi:hypothetical protein
MASPTHSPNPSLSPSPSPVAGPRGREDRWRGGRGSDSEDTPGSTATRWSAGERRRANEPESSRARREVRSVVSREVEQEAFDKLDDLEDPLEEDDGAPWEEPAHVVRKHARGRGGGKKVAARAAARQGREAGTFTEGTTREARQGRDTGAYAEFQRLCLLCTAPPTARLGRCASGAGRLGTCPVLCGHGRPQALMTDRRGSA